MKISELTHWTVVRTSDNSITLYVWQGDELIYTNVCIFSCMEQKPKDNKRFKKKAVLPKRR